MKLKIRVSAVIILAILLAACAPKSITTESGKSTWYANQVAIRINELSRTIIKLNTQVPPVISDADTRMFGTWAKSALVTLGTVPLGWEKTVQKGWNETKVKLPASLLSIPYIASVVAILDSVLTLLNPE